MAEWSSVVVVEAKSLALVCTKDQNRFVFLFGTKNKNFPPKYPKWKRKKKKKNLKIRKLKDQKQNQKNKNWTPFRSLEPTITQWFLY